VFDLDITSYSLVGEKESRARNTLKERCRSNILKVIAPKVNAGLPIKTFKIPNHRLEWTSRSEGSTMVYIRNVRGVIIRGPVIRQGMMHTPHEHTSTYVEFKYTHLSEQFSVLEWLNTATVLIFLYAEVKLSLVRAFHPLRSRPNQYLKPSIGNSAETTPRPYVATMRVVLEQGEAASSWITWRTWDANGR
jgi:hypothetical protein